MKPSLLLTATVSPHKSMTQLQVFDPNLRLSQYCSTFRSLIDSGAASSFRQIVIAENSGYDMTEFYSVMSRAPVPVKLIPVTSDISDVSYGRGFAEMNLIDKVMLDPTFYDLTKYDLIWKVTGRYEVRNLQKIVLASLHDLDLLINVRRYPQAWVDMHVFAFNKFSWALLRQHLHELKESSEVKSAEIAMFKIINELQYTSNIKLRTRLPYEPHICGIRGFDGRPYDSAKQRTKRYIRQIIRAFAPWVSV